jgi:nucleoid-associated protein YgaU
MNPLVVSWFGMFQSPDLSDRDGDIEYTVQDGDRLDRLSIQYYGTPFLWWVIAAKNQIDLPDIEMNGGRRIIITDPNYVVTQIGGRQVQVEP